ncbi:MAG: DUF2269 family protein [Thiobacillaceae bacterium]
MIKFLHILVVILALGTSAGLGIVLEFYGDNLRCGAFVLGAIKRIVAFFVVPGYVLMLATGLWMTHLSWSLTTKWIQFALVLWGVGAILLALSVTVLHKQTGLFSTEEPTSTAYRKVSLLGRALGAVTGLVIVIILYLMVFKPT